MENTSEVLELPNLHERVNFNDLLLANPNYFGNLPNSGFHPVLNLAGNIFYEELTTTGYNPATQVLEANIQVKQAYGYSGGLCLNGSIEYVRFFLDYGSGWVDQGYAGTNVHDIPTGPDCTKQNEKPLSYQVALPINPPKAFCSTPILPKIRAILSWNIIPTAGNPGFIPIWGNTMDCNIQISPLFLLLSELEGADLDKFMEVAVVHPQLTIAQVAQLVPGGENILQNAHAHFNPPELSISELAGLYKNVESGVSAARFGTKYIHQSLGNDPALINKNVEYLKELNINWQEIIGEINKTNANTNYEILDSVGLDYNQENLVASFKVKKPFGYSGNLCTAGSYEYIAFWADWNNNCNWQYLGTTSVNVHDFSDLPSNGLCYSGILPFDFTFYRKLCENPNVVKLRAVLSWATPPSTIDPDKLETWGNRLDTYIQIKPGSVLQPGQAEPLFTILGGIPIDHIDDTSGLTTSGATFALNQIAVEAGSPFGGVIVIQGPSYPGFKYRIKVTDLTNSSSHYLNNDLLLVGFLPNPPYVQYTTVKPDINNYYAYQTYDKNIDNVLARWSPGTDDLLELSLEIESVAGSFVKSIQMDNTPPVIALTVDDNGDCTHYKKGDTITGHYYVYALYLSSYNLTSSFVVGSVASGSISTAPSPGNPYAIPTSTATSPCGNIGLSAIDKAILDSQYVGHYVDTEQNICLQS